MFGSRAAREAYDTFDEKSALVAEATDDEGRRHGLWTVLHVLANELEAIVDDLEASGGFNYDDGPQ